MTTAVLFPRAETESLHVCDIDGFDKKDRFIGHDSVLIKISPIEEVATLAAFAGACMGAHHVKVTFPHDDVSFTIALPKTKKLFKKIP